jgi:hypothetical protein
LHSILTSSHSHRPHNRSCAAYIHGVFKRPHFVDVEMSWLNPSPERRRLRFSFQIYNVKDQNRVSDPTVLRPVPAKSGVSSCHPLPCQPIVPFASEFFRKPKFPIRRPNRSAVECLATSPHAGQTIRLIPLEHCTVRKPQPLGASAFPVGGMSAAEAGI